MNPPPPSPKKKKKKRDKEPLYHPSDPTINASSKPLNMNMLAVDLDPPNPISSFLKNLTLENPRDPVVLPVIDATDLDLSDLCLEGVFMIDDQPTVEEDDVFRPKLPPLPHSIFPPPYFILDNHTYLTHSSSIDSKHLFTIDNILPSKWHDEFFNMFSWCIAELQAPNFIVAQVIAKFVVRLTGRIREWWINLGEFRQRQATQCQTLEDFFIMNFLVGWYTIQK